MQKQLPLPMTLKIYRLLRGYTQERVASFMGVCREEVSYWETGSRPISAENLLKIIPYLGIPIEEITGGSDGDKEAQKTQNKAGNNHGV